MMKSSRSFSQKNEALSISRSLPALVSEQTEMTKLFARKGWITMWLTTHMRNTMPPNQPSASGMVYTRLVSFSLTSSTS